MSVNRKEIYEFAGFRLDVHERTIERIDGRPSAALPDKTFQTLVMLVQKRGHLVAKDDLLNHVWPDTVVEENNLEKRVHALRQFLGTDEDGRPFIETVRGHGYRFVGRVGVVEVSGSWLPESFRIVDDGKETGSENRSNGHRGSSQILKPVARTGEHDDPVVKATSSRTLFLALTVAAVFAIIGAIVYFAFVRPARKPPWTIVILPATSITTPERNELFDVGIAETLINNMSAVEGLIVRPLSSVREYSGTNADPVEVGRRQKADYVLSANYQIAGDRIKVTSQLVNVATGKIEETFQSQQDIGDVFAAQDAIASDFGRRLLARFEVSPAQPAKTRGTNNEEAYRAYVQGMYLLDNRSRGALEYFEKAVALDPQYSRAWAGKALEHNRNAVGGDDENYLKAIEAVNQALAINPNEADAYSALCHTKLDFEWDIAGAEQACRRSIELDPASAVARQNYSIFLSSRGRFDEALAQLRIAMETEPASYVNQVFYANVLYFARRFDEAVAQYRALVNLKPDRIPTYNWFIRALEAQGNEAEAYEWFMKSLVIEKRDDETIQRFKAAYERAGYRGVLLERVNTTDRDNPFRKAGIYAKLGDKDKAFEILEESVQNRVWHMITLFPVEPQFDSLRDDPRYDDLLRRIERR